MNQKSSSELRQAARPTRAALRRMAGATADLRWQRTLAEIDQAFCDPGFRVAELKRALSARGWLFAASRRHTGMTPARLIRECRMEVAWRLLRDTSLPVAEVATLVGLEGSLALQRLCRSWCGLTPSALRHHLRQVRPHLLELGDDVMTWWYWRRVVRHEITGGERRRIEGYFDAVYGEAGA